MTDLPKTQPKTVTIELTVDDIGTIADYLNIAIQHTKRIAVNIEGEESKELLEFQQFEATRLQGYFATIAKANG